MNRSILPASIVLLLTPQMLMASSDGYIPSPPEVVIQRSAFDYPANFSEQYALPECHKSPLVPADLEG